MIIIKIEKSDCTECGEKDLTASVEGEGLDTSTGGYTDIEALLDNVAEIILKI